MASEETHFEGHSRNLVGSEPGFPAIGIDTEGQRMSDLSLPGLGHTRPDELDDLYDSDGDTAKTPRGDDGLIMDNSAQDGNVQEKTVGGPERYYLGPRPTSERTEDVKNASLVPTPTVPSPLRCTHPSAASFLGSHASHKSPDVPSETFVDSLKARRRLSTQYDTASVSHFPQPTSTSRPGTSDTRREGPIYPNQSFAALHSQLFTPPYPFTGRNRSPIPSRASDYSASPNRSQGQISRTSSPRTHASTQSVGLFSPSLSNARYRDDDDAEGSQYRAPSLHPAHRAQPKETHTAVKEVDMISGNKMINNYEVRSRLGAGAHGTVKLGRNLNTGEAVAIKILRRFPKKARFGRQDYAEDKVKSEVAILKKARHPHVVGLIEVIDDPLLDKVYLILEYVARGEIIWRKQADKNIARFEKARVYRELSGTVDEAFEEAQVLAFNDSLLSRRAEKEIILTEQYLRAKEQLFSQSHESPTGSTFWSLEHGGEPEDEMITSVIINPVQSPLPALRENSMARRPSFDIWPEQSPEHGGPTTDHQLWTAHPASVESSGAVSPADFPTVPTWEGSLADEQMEHVEQNSDTRFQTILDEIRAQEWPDEEEEFRYVPCLTLSQAREAFRDTVLGLEYLHYQGVIHRDIKPANLLWTADYRVKISDFGVSYLGQPVTGDDDQSDLIEDIELAKTVGTPAFYAPEVCDPDLFDIERNKTRPKITAQVDVWALGVTLYAIVYGRLPFNDTGEMALYEKIARQEVFIPSKRLRGVDDTGKAPKNLHKREDDLLQYEDVDDELRDLLKRLLHKDPSRRITIKEVKHHPWVVRGIKDISGWIDETDPSRRTQGKRIEISRQDLDEAVAPLSTVARIFDKAKKSVKRFSSMVRGRDQRKRGDSSAKKPDSSISATSRASAGQESRRSSLRGDEQIYAALRASRENIDHPLAQSQVASPAKELQDSYFGRPLDFDKSGLGLMNASAVSHRPSPSDRTLSAAESIQTVTDPEPRPSAPARHASIPAEIPETLHQMIVVEPNVFSPAQLTNISRSGTRNRGFRPTSKRSNHSQASRCSSFEGLTSAYEGSHASPSIAFSAAVATGHVDAPRVPQEGQSPITRPHTSSAVDRMRPNDSSPEAFRFTQEQNFHRQIQERETAQAGNRSRCRANTAMFGPSSSDNDIFHTRQTCLPNSSQDPLSLVSSSDDIPTTGVSESFSVPSMPSVISGVSSISGTAMEDTPPDEKASLSSGTVTTGEKITPIPLQANLVPSSRLEDETAGYIGDIDYDNTVEDEYSEDEGIVFGGRK